MPTDAIVVGKWTNSLIPRQQATSQKINVCRSEQSAECLSLKMSDKVSQIPSRIADASVVEVEQRDFIVHQHLIEIEIPVTYAQFDVLISEAVGNFSRQSRGSVRCIWQNVGDRCHCDSRFNVCEVGRCVSQSSAPMGMKRRQRRSNSLGDIREI